MHRLVMLLVTLGIPLTCLPVQGQFVTRLTPRTLSAFEDYVKYVENSLAARLKGPSAFLDVESRSGDLADCLKGELQVRAIGDPQPVPIHDGLIHDWVGSVFIPHTTIERVLAVLENFDDHHKIYPSVAESKTLSHHGHEVTGFWQLRQKGMVPVVLDVHQEVKYEPVTHDKWIGRAYARDIVETDTTPFSRRHKFPAGEGHGYLWRLYSYWSFEIRDRGVLAECRTLSLSRDIPQGLGWAVGPYVVKTPHNSLVSTLEQTRKVASRN